MVTARHVAKFGTTAAVLGDGSLLVRGIDYWCGEWSGDAWIVRLPACVTPV